MQQLSFSKKIAISVLPFLAGMAGSWATSALSDSLALLVLSYFLAAAVACQAMVIVSGNAVARRMADLGDRPDGTVQQLALATRLQHQAFLWYAKLAGVSFLAWLLMLLTR